MTEAHRCEQLAQSYYAAFARVKFEPTTCWSQVQRSTCCTTIVSTTYLFTYLLTLTFSCVWDIHKVLYTCVISGIFSISSQSLYTIFVYVSLQTHIARIIAVNLIMWLLLTFISVSSSMWLLLTNKILTGIRSWTSFASAVLFVLVITRAEKLRFKNFF